MMAAWMPALVVLALLLRRAASMDTQHIDFENPEHYPQAGLRRGCDDA
jgi:hypothetical protein